NIRMNLTADWSLDQYGVTLRETVWGSDHGYVSPNSGGEEIPNNQASVGITDLEGRYNITDELQIAIGANNLFDIHGDINGPAPNCAALPAGVIIRAGGSCKQGPNQANGEVQTNGNGQVYQTPIGGFFDPN